MLITGVTQIDADEEKNIDEHYIIKGAIFIYSEIKTKNNRVIVL